MSDCYAYVEKQKAIKLKKIRDRKKREYLRREALVKKMKNK